MTEANQSAPIPKNSFGPESWANLIATSRPLIMGILNITPDSFADHGAHFDQAVALAHARELVAAGADILDVGGESTRPYADPLPLKEELRRVIPLIEAIAPEIAIPISIDTYKAPVARAALEAGATIINDISALRFDPDMASLAAGAKAPVILMHMQGSPRDMQRDPHYDDLLGEITAFFRERLEYAVGRGIARELLVLDPGLGFGKTRDHNLEILRRLEVFLELGCPLLVGPSRKTFIGHLTGLPAGPERDAGTLAALLAAVQHGARIVRTHNVAYARQFFAVWEAIFQADRV